MREIKSITKLLTVALIMSLFISATTPVVAEAKVTYTNGSGTSSSKKSGKYFSDVKSKTEYCKQIEWLAKKGAYAGIAKKGGKFQPTCTITRKQFGMILNNLYGDRINLKITNSSAGATQKFVTSTLTEVTKQLGYKVTWNGGAPKAKVSRANASHYLRQMIACAEGALDP